MNIENKLKQKIDNKTKPFGALGQLEKIAYQIGRIQNSVFPQVNNPHILLFAGDHGISDNPVSLYPKEVTYQMVLNFLHGGAAINVFARQHNIDLKIIDAGVDYNFEAKFDLIDYKISNGTKDILKEKAMNSAQLELCFNYGKKSIDFHIPDSSNIIGFGEMGIGNTSIASLIMSALCNMPIEECIGRGTGLDNQQLAIKINILKEVKELHGTINNPHRILETYGGFEIAQMTSAMLRAFEKNMVILVDGFIATVAFLVAFNIKPGIRKNAVFCHLSNEQGHAKLLNYLDVKPLIGLEMRLGEGTGCAVAYPIIKSAINFLNEMASFEDAGIANKVV